MIIFKKKSFFWQKGKSFHFSAKYVNSDQKSETEFLFLGQKENRFWIYEKKESFFFILKNKKCLEKALLTVGRFISNIAGHLF